MLDERQNLHRQERQPEELTLRLANRHGLVTGATGTGKTVTLQVLAEGFSEAGVPVFAADVKGDLSGIAIEGVAKEFLVKRAEEVVPGGWRGEIADRLLGPVRREGPSGPHHRLGNGAAAARPAAQSERRAVGRALDVQVGR